MSELNILLVFVPLSVLAFSFLGRAERVLGWTSVLVALACNIELIRPRLTEPQPRWWIPVLALVSITIFEMAREKMVRVLPVLGALFMVQALLTDDLTVIVILLLFSDAFFCAELFPKSGFESFLVSITSLIPVTIGVFLKLHGTELAVCVGLTIVLRIFSWPFLNLTEHIGGARKHFLGALAPISAFILWRTQTPSDPALWAVIWMTVGAVLSLGAKPTELAVALSLALFSLGPNFGLLSVALWPLLFYRGKNLYILMLATSAVGAVVVGQLPQVLVPEAALGAAALLGFAYARVFVATETETLTWVEESASLIVFISLLVLVIFSSSDIYVNFDTVNFVFAGGLIFFSVLGLLIYKRKPKLFLPIQGWGRLAFPRRQFKNIKDEGASLGTSKIIVFPSKVFDALDSEAGVILLLGVLGAILLWGLQ